MTTFLTDEQRKALNQAQNIGPIQIVDPKTKATYILIRTDLYDQSKALLESIPFDPEEAYPLMDEVAASEGWNDPEMDVYNQFDPRRKS